MNETPRLRSAFPTTPQTQPRFRNSNPKDGSSFDSPGSPFSRRTAPSTKQPTKVPVDSKSTGDPFIPTEVVDAPSQRFYVFAFYIALTAWRLYNSFGVENDLDSTWLFLKWIGIDAAFFVALPAFRIPWLEFSFATTFTIWLLHAIANAFLMYKIPLPLLSWLGALVKVAYDRELAISETRVKPADILRNSSIILGKQIIHILPEGSAILNPEKTSFCLDASHPSVELPIQINQTTPISIELHRFDLDTNEVETILIGSKQAKQLKKHADAGIPRSETNSPRTLRYPVSKKGLYQLHRVIDTTKLEVRKRSFDVAVVPCPKASISTLSEDRCTGDLSNVALKLSGVPPFKVKYSKTVNQKQLSSIVQNVQPRPDSGYMSEEEAAEAVVDPNRPQMGWTRSTTETFEINESLHQNGSYSYMVEEVEDGLGNKVTYYSSTSKDPRAPRVQSLTVHNRPRISLTLPNSKQSGLIPVRRGDSTSLPISIHSASQFPPSDWPLKIKYTYHADIEDETIRADEFSFDVVNDRSKPQVQKPGRYNIESVDSKFCHGEIAEPSSCLLFNPPDPDLALEKQDIFDQCAGSPIGMTLNLDFTGTPPFKVRYTITHKGQARVKQQSFSGMRGQIELLENAAGSYIYNVLEIEDSVYGPRSLKDKSYVFQQDIMPPASATFYPNAQVIKACLDEPVLVEVALAGQGPWKLDYELVHGGKRKKYSVQSDVDMHAISLPGFKEGGTYAIVLTGVQDKSGCRTPLKDQRQIEIRPEQPRAGFGEIDGKRSTLAMDGKTVQLPLRLKGNSPWAVRIRRLEDPDEPFVEFLKNANSVFSVNEPGTYEIISVHDSCPGVVDAKANTFEVSWIPRPTLAIKDSDVQGDSPRSVRKPPVCQNDESSLFLSFSGSAPYHIKYHQRFEPIKGPAAVSNKEGSFAGTSAVINLDTSRAGEYTYSLNELSDSRYPHDKEHFTPLIVKQQVYAPPSAKFSEPGKTYGYCKDDPSFTSSVEAETENIPITFNGVPPFSIEIAIVHHGVSSRPEIIRQKDIQSTTYAWPLSRSTLDLGTHSVSIRSVKDSRGCESIIESDPSSVRIFVSSPPTILALESHDDFCVGEHVSFSLSGQPPFDVYYTFQGRERKAHVTGNEFRRLAESPGEFVITGVSDNAMGNGKCRARKEIKKVIHPYPTVEMGRGRTLVSDIHEGGEVDISFSFTGSPPFEFTYIRSENVKRSSRSAPKVLETRHDSSDAFTKVIRASDEGVYEVVSIKDRYCSYTKPSHKNSAGGSSGQKRLLTFK